MPITFKFLPIGIMLVLAGCYLFVSSTAAAFGYALLGLGILIEMAAILYAIIPQKWLSK